MAGLVALRRAEAGPPSGRLRREAPRARGGGVLARGPGPRRVQESTPLGRPARAPGVPTEAPAPIDGAPPNGPQARRPSRAGVGLGSFGEFELLKEVGRGGMGVVYKAREVALNRIVALKLTFGDGQSLETALQRFR